MTTAVSEAAATPSATDGGFLPEVSSPTSAFPDGDEAKRCTSVDAAVGVRSGGGVP